MRRHQRPRVRDVSRKTASRFTAGSWSCSAECRPDAVAIENMFYAANVRSALKLGHARGVAMLAAVEAGRAGGRVHAGGDQARGRRLRARGEAAGAADGQAAARAWPRCRRRTMRPTRWRSPSATCTRSRRRAPARRRGRRQRRRRGGPGQQATSWRHYRPADRDRILARTALSRSSPIASWSTSAASATTCPCRCRRSTASASRAATSRCASTRTCARTRWRCTGSRRALELELFERLIGISGIGPKLALAVLSGIEPLELIRAIERGDLARLTAIPGVGKKTSERIVLELKDRLPRAQAGRRRPAAAPAPAVAAARRCALGAHEPGVSSAARRKSRRCRGQGRA